MTNSGGSGCGRLSPLGYVTGTCYMAGNADLKPETSTAGEIGVAWEQTGWDVGLTYFHTDFKNKIDYAPLGFYQGLWWTMMKNIQKARTRGLEGSHHPADQKSDLAQQPDLHGRGENLSTGANLLKTPKLSLYSALGWQANDQLFAELSAEHTGKELDAGKLAEKAYTIVDTIVSYKVTPQWTVRGGVQNLFKKGPMADGLVDYYVPGRRMFVGLTSRF